MSRSALRTKHPVSQNEGGTPMKPILLGLLAGAGILLAQAQAAAQVIVAYETPGWVAYEAPRRVTTSYYVTPVTPRYVATYAPSSVTYAEYRDPLGLLPPRRVTNYYYP